MIGYSREGKVAVVEFQRPEVRNAIGLEMLGQLNAAFDRAEDENVPVIMVTGQGTVFSAGADLKGAVNSAEFLEGLMGFYVRAETMKATIVAYLNGSAYGAGVQMALMADLRVVAPDAHISIPAAKLGISVDKWTVRRLEALVGNGHARNVLMAAEKLDSETLGRLGFANKIGDRDAALAYCQGLTQLAPLSLQNYKYIFNSDYAREPVTDAERARLEAIWHSDDMREALTARFEKRTPNFKGR